MAKKAAPKKAAAKKRPAKKAAPEPGISAKKAEYLARQKAAGK